jgi:hypothetical protein
MSKEERKEQRENQKHEETGTGYGKQTEHNNLLLLHPSCVRADMSRNFAERMSTVWLSRPGLPTTAHRAERVLMSSLSLPRDGGRSPAADLAALSAKATRLGPKHLRSHMGNRRPAALYVSSSGPDPFQRINPRG